MQVWPTVPRSRYSADSCVGEWGSRGSDVVCGLGWVDRERGAGSLK